MPEELVPERHMGVQCGQHVTGSGPMSYRCEREQGHSLKGEPHYAKESTASRTRWSNWKREQLAAEAEKEREAAEAAKAHEHTFHIEGNNVVCEDCGHSLTIQAPNTTGTTNLDPASTALPTNDEIESAFSASMGAQAASKAWAEQFPHVAQGEPDDAPNNPSLEPLQGGPDDIAPTAERLPASRSEIINELHAEGFVVSSDVSPLAEEPEPTLIPFREKVELAVLDSLTQEGFDGQHELANTITDSVFKVFQDLLNGTL